MIHSSQYRSLFVLFIVVISEANARQTPSYLAKDDGLDNMPPDFVSFVKGLDTMVFQSERKRNLTKVNPKTYANEESKKLLNRRRYSDSIKASQTSAIRDILMLKLVSYYEDKYNVGQTKMYTTPQMLELIDIRKTTLKPMPIDRYEQLRETRRISPNFASDTFKNTEIIENTNALEQTNQQPLIDEVISLR